MKVRCLTERPTKEQALRLGCHYDWERQAFSVVTGKTYLVFGLSLVGGELWVEISDDYEQISAAPLLLFEIVDPRVPPIWILAIQDAGAASLWPRAFHRAGFFEDLVECDPAAVAELRLIRAQLEAEG